MLRAVLFDAFGTLLDARGLHLEATKHILVDLGLSHLDADEVHERWDEELLALEPQATAGLSTWDVFKRSLRACLAKYGVLLGPEELDIAIEVLEETIRKRTKPFHGALKLPAFCRELGLKVGLISNADGELLRSILRQTGLEKLMDVVIISDEVRIAKPDRRIFLMALEALGVRPDEAMMVGDWRPDVIGAKEVGLACALVLWGREPSFLLDLPRELMPDIMVERLLDLRGPILSLCLGQGRKGLKRGT